MLCIIDYPKSAQRRFWSDCANAQADLNLHRAHVVEGKFLTLRPRYRAHLHSLIRVFALRWCILLHPMLLFGDSESCMCVSVWYNIRNGETVKIHRETRFIKFIANSLYNIGSYFICLYVCTFPCQGRFGFVNQMVLTHLSLGTHKRDFVKQCRPGSDAATRGVWSGTTMFVISSEISEKKKHGNNKN